MPCSAKWKRMAPRRTEVARVDSPLTRELIPNVRSGGERGCEIADRHRIHLPVVGQFPNVGVVGDEVNAKCPFRGVRDGPGTRRERGCLNL